MVGSSAMSAPSAIRRAARALLPALAIAGLAAPSAAQDEAPPVPATDAAGLAPASPPSSRFT